MHARQGASKHRPSNGKLFFFLLQHDLFSQPACTCSFGVFFLACARSCLPIACSSRFRKREYKAHLFIGPSLCCKHTVQQYLIQKTVYTRPAARRPPSACVYAVLSHDLHTTARDCLIIPSASITYEGHTLLCSWTLPSSAATQHALLTCLMSHSQTQVGTVCVAISPWCSLYSTLHAQCKQTDQNEKRTYTPGAQRRS